MGAVERVMQHSNYIAAVLAILGIISRFIQIGASRMFK
jgi:hypothetical protein